MSLISHAGVAGGFAKGGSLRCRGSGSSGSFACGGLTGKEVKYGTSYIYNASAD